MNNVYSERISALRQIMAANGWDAVVVSGSDPHSSEYPAPRWKQVEWLTGFTGEAGDVVVTMDHAGLWTDSRYFIQAISQLEGTGVELHKTRVPGAVLIPEWLGGRASVVALDGLCQNVGFVLEVERCLLESHPDKDFRIVDVPDMLEMLWQDRPSVPMTPVVTLDVDCFGGVSRRDKIDWLRKWMMLEDKDSILLTALDQIAWLLNVRGNDIEYNPVVMSYLLVTQDYIKWFVRKSPFADMDPETADSYEELRMDGVEIEDYDAVCFALSESPCADSWKLCADVSSLNYHIYSYVMDACPQTTLCPCTSPVILEKAVKTPEEIAFLRQTYIDDGLAVEHFLYWLETELAEKGTVSEWEASQKLTSCRQAIPGYRGNSFENISAYGANAALPHYSTPEFDSAMIRPGGLYLVDSGGQYLTGTTDITRTVPVGKCTMLEMEDYTLVLKGMISLSMAVFPRGTAGCQLDVLARNALWRCKRNYGHGTGHGIGYWLCVHEGPQDIRQNFNSQPLLPGMVTSNEPGIYREGQHGVRHENIVACREAGNNGFGEWLEFETLTCCHIDTSAVIPDLLSSDEKEWLNAYNEHVFRTLSPLMSSEESLWLRNKTLPLD